MAFEYRAAGSIDLKTPATLADVEEFCREARKLGVAETSPLFTSRQGLVGPITGWHFAVPVVPKNELA